MLTCSKQLRPANPKKAFVSWHKRPLGNATLRQDAKSLRFAETERAGSCPLPEEAAGLLYHASNEIDILCCGIAVRTHTQNNCCEGFGALWSGPAEVSSSPKQLVCHGECVDRVCRHDCTSSEHLITQETCRRR